MAAEPFSLGGISCPTNWPWDHDWRAPTTAFGLYAEFASKQELFDAARQRHDEVVLERNFGSAVER